MVGLSHVAELCLHESEFSSHLKSALQNSPNTLPDPCPDVLLYTSILPLASTEFFKSQKAQLRGHATCIWNSCNIISASNNPQHDDGVAKLRAFAYLLLASVAPPRSKKSGSISKLFQNSITAAKECLRAGHIELAGKLLELEADAPLLLHDKDPIRQDVQEQISCNVDYYCLRLLHDWKRKRADLADRHYSQLLNMLHHLRESDVMKIVDLLLEIGMECLNQLGAINAAEWLERALHMMDADSAHSDFTGSDMRLNVLHYLGKSALNRCTPHTHEPQSRHYRLSQVSSAMSELTAC